MEAPGVEGSVDPEQSFSELMRRAARYEASMRLNAAEADYRAAIDIFSEDSRPYFGLANVLLRGHRLDEAEINFLRAIELNPDVGVYHNNLAWVYLETGRLVAAANTVTHGLSLDIDQRYIYLDTLGVIEMRLGNLSMAENYLIEAEHLLLGWDARGLYRIYLHQRELYLLSDRIDDALEVERKIQSLGFFIPGYPLYWPY
jgi:tetratricopeptide (TPR) repeat protein